MEKLLINSNDAAYKQAIDQALEVFNNRRRRYKATFEQEKLWAEKLLEEIPLKSNEDLLSATLQLAGGDDYDGCMTDIGQYEYTLLTAELEKRLKEIGFLKPDSKI